MPSEESSTPSTTLTTVSLRRAAIATLITLAALGGLWALDLAVLHGTVLTAYQRGDRPDLPALSPLYAFWLPAMRPTAALFVIAAISLVLLAPRLIDPARMRRGVFTLLLVVAALALPFALFLVRESPGDLGKNFLIYRGEEYYEDALRIRDLGGFLRGYVALNPKLSSHGRTHPPGNAVYLYLAGQVLGSTSFGEDAAKVQVRPDGSLAAPSPVGAGLAVLLAFAVGAFFAYRALATALGERGGRAAALLLLASPAVLDFACTSMDAVFFAVAAVALWAAFKAFAADGAAAWGLGAGAALFAAMLFSFSAFPLGLFLLFYGLARGAAGAVKGTLAATGGGERAANDDRTDRTNRTGILNVSYGARFAAVRLGAVLFAFVACAVLFALLTGFDFWDCFVVAHSQHVTQMTRFIGRPPAQLYAYLTFGNAVAFLIGAGVALTALVGLRLVRAARARWIDSLTFAAGVAFLVMCAGGIYTMEVERIFLFAIPWLAGAALAGGALPTPGALRLLLGLGLAQAFVMEALLFTLW